MDTNVQTVIAFINHSNRVVFNTKDNKALFYNGYTQRFTLFKNSSMYDSKGNILLDRSSISDIDYVVKRYNEL